MCICRKQIEFPEELLQDIRELQLDPQGKQILMVFRFTRLAPVDKAALDQVRELWRKHALLSMRPEKAPLATPSGKEMPQIGRGEKP